MTPRRILICAPNWIGDLVMATSSFAAVRQAYPGATIAMLLRPGREGVLSGSPDHDRVLPDLTHRSLREFFRGVKELRRERFDLALLCRNSLRSALLCRLAGIPRRVGYRRDGRGILLTDKVDYEYENGRRKPVPMPSFFARLCAEIGVEAGDGRPRLFVPEDCEAAAAEWRRRLGIEPGEELIGLNPGASFGASKLWPPEHFAALGDKLYARYKRRCIVFVGPGEEPIGEAIAARMKTPVINTARSPLPLDVLKPFVRDLKLLVTTDTGPRQYAVAFDVPVVCVMGPTDPRYSAANLERSEVVRHDVPCGPCHLKTCPLDHRCMVDISPAEVLERTIALEERLAR